MGVNKDKGVLVSIALQEIAAMVQDALEMVAGEKLAFLLITQTGHVAQYVSNTERASGVKMMKSLIEKWEKGQATIPAHYNPDLKPEDFNGSTTKESHGMETKNGTMTAAEYHKIAGTTCKSGAAIVASITPNLAHAVHMALGIGGEIAELLAAIRADDKENAREEIGDVLWYIDGMTNLLDWSYELQGAGLSGRAQKEKSAGDTVMEIAGISIIEIAGEIIDLVKKSAVYNAPLSQIEVGKCLNDLIYMLAQIAGVFDKTLDELRYENIEKLRKRYPNLGYSDADAKARADK